MKQFLTSLFIILSFSAFSQTTITNGKVEMNIETGNDMLPSMTITYFIKGDQMKMETGGNEMFAMAFYQDIAKNSVTMTMNMMGMQKGFKATPEELAADAPKDSSAPVVKYTDEQKTIAGYACKKVIVTQVDPVSGANKTSTLWVYPDLKLPDMKGAGSAMGGLGSVGGTNANIKGLVLEMESESPMGGTMKMTTSKIDLKTEIKDDVFVVSKDYDLKSYKEFKEEMKGMMGGGQQ
jgi:hypothetical protein